MIKYMSLVRVVSVHTMQIVNSHKVHFVNPHGIVREG